MPIKKRWPWSKPRAPLPAGFSQDMLLLGVGDDGLCGSLHPKSERIKAVGDGTVTFGIHKPGKNQSLGR